MLVLCKPATRQPISFHMMWDRKHCNLYFVCVRYFSLGRKKEGYFPSIIQMKTAYRLRKPNLSKLKPYHWHTIHPTFSIPAYPSICTRIAPDLHPPTQTYPLTEKFTSISLRPLREKRAALSGTHTRLPIRVMQHCDL